MQLTSVFLGHALFDVEGKAAGGRAARALTKLHGGWSKMGGSIIDSRGRRWTSALHPRDSRGRFIETGGIARVFGRGQGKVLRVSGRDMVEVQFPDGSRENVQAKRLTMIRRPDGSAPTKSRTKVLDEDERREKDPNRPTGEQGDGDDENPDLDGDGIPDDEEPEDVDDEDADDPGDDEENPVRRPGARPGDLGVVTRPDGRRILVDVIPDAATGRVVRYREVGDAQPRTVQPGQGVPLVRQDDYDRDALRAAYMQTSGRGFASDDEARALIGQFRKDAPDPAAAPKPTPDVPEVRDAAVPEGRQRRVKVSEMSGEDLANEVRAMNRAIAALPAGDDRKRKLVRRRKDVVKAMRARGLEPEPMQQSDGPSQVAAPERTPTPDVAPDAVPETVDEDAAETERQRADEESAARDRAEAEAALDRGAADIEAEGRDDEQNRRREEVLNRLNRDIPSYERAVAASDRHRDAERQAETHVDPDTGYVEYADGGQGWHPGVSSESALENVEEYLRDEGLTEANGFSEREIRNMVLVEAWGQFENELDAHGFGPDGNPRADTRLKTDEQSLDELEGPSDEDLNDEEVTVTPEDLAREAGVDPEDPAVADARRRTAEAEADAAQARAREAEARADAAERQNRGTVDALASQQTGERADDDRAADRERGREVLADVPAEPVRDDRRQATDRVLPTTGGSGDGAGRSSDGEAQAALDEQLARADSGVPGGEGSGAGDSAAGPRVPDAGAGDGGPADGGGAAPRVGRGGRRAPRAVRAPSRGAARQVAGRFSLNSQSDAAPDSPNARLAANMAALRLLRKLQAEGRPATPSEQAVLARWSGWGSIADVFSPNANKPYRAEHAELKKLLSPAEWKEARDNFLNAHYTDVALVDEVWKAVEDLGFTKGDVLEPGSGIGNFIGRAPEGANMTGVELHQITAGMSELLYPDATIHNESFGDSPFRENSFDAVVGNVPFGAYPIRDKRYNPNLKHSIHNHFLLKSIAETKPGGVVAVITSAMTLNGSDRDARRKMYRDADLIGAVRLPAGTHAEAAGTDVVTDVLLFRKRKEGEAPGDDSWLEDVPAVHPDGSPVLGIKNGDQPRRQVTTNRYFVEHPENVLGEVIDGGYNGIGVRKTGDPIEQAKESLARLTADAKNNRRGFDAVPDETGRAKRDIGSTREGRIILAGETQVPGKRKGEVVNRPRFQQYQDGELVDFNPGTGKSGMSNETAAELAELLNIRDQYAQLREIEAATRTDDDPALVAARSRLNRLYDDYVRKYGPITRQFERPDGEDEDGNPKFARVPDPLAIRAFKADEGHAEVFGLEYDFRPAGDRGGKERTGTAKKADVFTKRQYDADRELAEQTDDPADAMALLAERGEPLTYANMARVLGVTEAEARERSTGLLFQDHTGSGRLIPRADYLSGNVRQRLKEVRAAAETNPDLQPNVDALEAAKPRDAVLSEIPLQLGATWVSPRMVEQFARSLMGPSNEVKVTYETGMWKVKTPSIKSYGRSGVLEERWGTDARSFYDLLQVSLRQQHHRVVVKRKNEDGSEYEDVKASKAATAKAADIRQAFVDWAWADAKVADSLTEAYNEKFRAIVPRNYDGSAERALPGMARGMSLRQHQNDAVTRMVSEPAVLLEHVVGSGKTFTLAAGAMELRRLGLVKKPMLAVPNAILGQWAREIKQLYPDAKVLTADKDDLDGPDARKRFAAKVAASDWDLVIMARTAFESIPVSIERERAYFGRQLAEYEEQMRRVKGDKVKEKALQTQIKKAQAKLEKQMAKRKDKEGINFDDLGVDYIMADEAHAYKNLDFHTMMQGIQSPEGAGRARDMDMKLDLLRERKREAGEANPRVATFATGTPISNSLAEMYTMTRFMRPDLLEEAGIPDFDAWAATFAKVESKPEVDTAAHGYTDRIRMRGFTEALGDGLRLWRTFSDTKTADHLNLPRPTVKGGERQIHVLEMTEAQQKAKASLKSRVDNLPPGRPEEGDDTHVAIIGDGRRAALDPRLLSERGLLAAGITRDDDMRSPKIEAMASQVADIWAANKDRTYKVRRPDADESPDAVPDSPNKGAFQMVFIENGTPKKGQFNAYDELKRQLVERGMNPDRIRFIQEVAGSSAKKDRLFDDARQGLVDVIIGTTEAMGTGVNAQNRLIALHHGEGSWKPSDIEQREGRAIRQGNQNNEVEIHAYVTKGTHDEKTWDMVSYKQKVLDLIAQGDYDMGAVEFQDDVDPLTNYDVLTGAAATDPLVMDRREVASALDKLRAAETNYNNQRAYARSTINEGRRAVREYESNVERLERALAQRTDDFAMNIRQGAYDYGAGAAQPNRAKAAEAFGDKLQGLFDETYRWENESPGNFRPIGTLGTIRGFYITAESGNLYGKKIRLGLNERDSARNGLPIESFYVEAQDIRTPEGRLGVLARLDNRVSGMENRVQVFRDAIAETHEEIGSAEVDANRPFARQRELDTAVRSAELLDSLLTGTLKGDGADVAETDEDGGGRGSSAARLDPETERRLRQEYADLREEAAEYERAEKQRKIDALNAAKAAAGSGSAARDAALQKGTSPNAAADAPRKPAQRKTRTQTGQQDATGDYGDLMSLPDTDPEALPTPPRAASDLPPREERTTTPEALAAEAGVDVEELPGVLGATAAAPNPDTDPDGAPDVVDVESVDPADAPDALSEVADAEEPDADPITEPGPAVTDALAAPEVTATPEVLAEEAGVAPEDLPGIPDTPAPDDTPDAVDEPTTEPLTPEAPDAVDTPDPPDRPDPAAAPTPDLAPAAPDDDDIAADAIANDLAADDDDEPVDVTPAPEPAAAPVDDDTAVDAIADAVASDDDEPAAELPEPAALAAPAAPRTPRAKKPSKLDELTYHEQYGDVSKRQLRAYRKHNVSPSDHDALVDYYGDDHAAIAAAVAEPANHPEGSNGFSDYLWRRNRERGPLIESGLRPLIPETATDEEAAGVLADAVADEQDQRDADTADASSGGGAGAENISGAGAGDGGEADGPDADVPDPDGDRPDAAAPDSERPSRDNSGRGNDRDGGVSDAGPPESPGRPAGTPDLPAGRDDDNTDTDDPAPATLPDDAPAATEEEQVDEPDADTASAGSDEPGEDPTPDITAGEGEVGANGLTFQIADGRLVLSSNAFDVRDDVSATRLFELVPFGSRGGKRWMARALDPEGQQRALNALRERFGVEPPERKKARKPTPQQQAIIDAILGGGDVAVEALAGTGKTSTLEATARAVAEAAPGKRIFYGAFNKTVQVEAQGRMPSNVESRTGDSVGYTAAPPGLQAKFRGMRPTRTAPPTIRAIRDADAVAAHLGIRGDLETGPDEPPLTPARQAQLALRAVTAYAISADDELGPQHLGDSPRSLLPYAQRAWEDLTSDDGRLFVGNDHLTKLWALSRPDLSKSGASGLKHGADIVFFDEAQDMNPVIAKVLGDNRGRVQLVYVGDPNQAIYGFRGATNELGKVEVDTRLPMTVTFRFGQPIANQGNKFLAFSGSPHRLEGDPTKEADVLPPRTMMDADAILVRSNGGMVSMAVEQQAAGRVVGVPKGTKADLRKLAQSAAYLQAVTAADEEVERQRGEGIENPVRPPVAAPVEIHDDLAPFANWGQVLEEAEEGDDPKIRTLVGIVDTAQGADALTVLAEGLKELGDQKDPRTPDVVITTAHKAKGLEWDRVRIGDDFRGPRRNAQTGIVTFPEPEELRLAYVAVTRAQQALDPGSLSWIDAYTNDDGTLNDAGIEATGFGVPDVTPDVPEPVTVEDLRDSLVEAGVPEDVAQEAAEAAVPGPVGVAEDVAPDGDRESADTPEDTQTPDAPPVAPPLLPDPPTTPVEEPTPTAADTPDEPEDPADISGSRAKWVPVSALMVGDTARVRGIDTRQRPIEAAGYVSGIEPRTVARRGRGNQDMIAVTLAENPDGSGAQTTVLTRPNAIAAQAVNSTLANPEGVGAPPSLPEQEVLNGSLPDRMPNDSQGNPIFPGSAVDVVGGEPGTAASVTPGTVEVNRPNDSGNEPEVPVTSVTVTDGGAARPEGWTADGDAVEPDQLVNTPAGPAVVTDVIGDDIEVTNAAGDREVIPAADVHVVATDEDVPAVEADAPAADATPEQEPAASDAGLAQSGTDTPPTPEGLRRAIDRARREVDDDQSLLDTLDRDADPERFDRLEAALRERRLRIAEMEASLTERTTAATPPPAPQAEDDDARAARLLRERMTREREARDAAAAAAAEQTNIDAAREAAAAAVLPNVTPGLDDDDRDSILDDINEAETADDLADRLARESAARRNEEERDRQLTLDDPEVLEGEVLTPAEADAILEERSLTPAEAERMVNREAEAIVDNVVTDLLDSLSPARLPATTGGGLPTAPTVPQQRRRVEAVLTRAEREQTAQVAVTAQRIVRRAAGGRAPTPGTIALIAQFLTRLIRRIFQLLRAALAAFRGGSPRPALTRAAADIREQMPDAPEMRAIRRIARREGIDVPDLTGRTARRPARPPRTTARR